MSRVFWDSNLYVYLFENCGVSSRKVQELRAKMLVRGDQLLTSTLTMGENSGEANGGRPAAPGIARDTRVLLRRRRCGFRLTSRQRSSLYRCAGIVLYLHPMPSSWPVPLALGLTCSLRITYVCSVSRCLESSSSCLWMRLRSDSALSAQTKEAARVRAPPLHTRNTGRDFTLSSAEIQDTRWCPRIRTNSTWRIPSRPSAPRWARSPGRSPRPDSPGSSSAEQSGRSAPSP